MDLSKMSDEDLQAIAAGDLSKVSDSALQIMAGGSPKSTTPSSMVQDPKSGAYAMQSLVSNASMGQSFMSGAGKKLDDMIAGTKQLFNFGTGRSNEELDKEREFKDAAYAPVKNRNPGSASFGEAMPGAVAAGLMTGGAGLPAAILGGAAGGALPEVLSYQKAPTLEDSLYKRAGNATKEAAIGGIGGGAGWLATRAIMPIGSAVQGASPEALNAARQIGFNPTPAQVTQSPLLQNVENWFSRTPGVSGRFQAIKEGQQAAINRQAARAIGQNSDTVNEGVLRAAERAIGDEFARINANASPDASGLLNTLINLDSENLAKGSFQSGEVARLVDRGLDLAARGRVTGEAYHAIRSELGSLAEGTRSTTYARALRQVQRVLDGAANDSLSVADQEALAMARSQWGAFKALTSGKSVTDGNVNLLSLTAAMKQGSKRAGVMTGRSTSDLMPLKRIAEGFKTPVNPNSGSLAMTDRFMEAPITSGLLGLANSLPGRAYLSAPMQGYLTNRVLPPTVEQLMLRGAAPAGLLSFEGAQ